MTLMNLAIILGGIWVATSLLLIWAAKKAPLGYQDEAGFHFGADHVGQPDRRNSTQESRDIGATWTSEHPAPVPAR
jgi:hypothetical protein